MFQPGQVMGGHYEIIGSLGGGGMGSVYHARDRHLNREVALKFMHAHLLTKEEYRQRFWREGQVLASLHHHNIVAVHTLEIEEKSQAPFLVLEYAPGKPLTHFIRVRAPLLDLMSYFLQTLYGIEACHAAGVIHRDIKPDNILIDGEHVKLVDFGLAKTGTRLTRTGVAIGTATYMSPEQCRGKVDLTAKSDIYSLGIILWELLLGRPTFTAGADTDNHFMALCMKHLNEPVPIETVRGHPQMFRYSLILERMLSKDCEKRPELGEIISFVEQTVRNLQEAAAAAGHPLPPPDLRVTLGSPSGRKG